MLISPMYIAKFGLNACDKISLKVENVGVAAYTSSLLSMTSARRGRTEPSGFLRCTHRELIKPFRSDSESFQKGISVKTSNASIDSYSLAIAMFNSSMLMSWLKSTSMSFRMGWQRYR